MDPLRPQNMTGYSTPHLLPKTPPHPSVRYTPYAVSVSNISRVKRSATTSSSPSPYRHRQPDSDSDLDLAHPVLASLYDNPRYFSGRDPSPARCNSVRHSSRHDASIGRGAGANRVASAYTHAHPAPPAPWYDSLDGYYAPATPLDAYASPALARDSDSDSPMYMSMSSETIAPSLHGYPHYSLSMSDLDDMALASAGTDAAPHLDSDLDFNSDQTLVARNNPCTQYPSPWMSDELLSPDTLAASTPASEPALLEARHDDNASASATPRSTPIPIPRVSDETIAVLMQPMLMAWVYKAV